MDVSSKLLKACCNEFVYPLTLLLNLLLKEGKFPSSLNIAKVIPLFKQGNAAESCNYCPILLIFTFPKVFEKIVMSRLFQPLSDHDLLSAHQHGFNGCSTTSVVISQVEVIIWNLEAGDTTTTIRLARLQQGLWLF